MSAAHRGIRFGIALLGYAAASGCRELTSRLEPDPENAPPNAGITITATPSAASTVDVVALEARFDPRASTSLVVFTASGGYFVESGSKTVTIRATLDSASPKALVARTAYRSDSTLTAVVRATVIDRYETTVVRFTKP